MKIAGNILKYSILAIIAYYGLREYLIYKKTVSYKANTSVYEWIKVEAIYRGLTEEEMLRTTAIYDLKTNGWF